MLTIIEMGTACLIRQVGVCEFIVLTGLDYAVLWRGLSWRRNIF